MNEFRTPTLDETILEEIRVGAPWTQDGTKMLERIKFYIMFKNQEYQEKLHERDRMDAISKAIEQHNP